MFLEAIFRTRGNGFLWAASEGMSQSAMIYAVFLKRFRGRIRRL